VAQLYPRALGNLHVACYDSQGYGGGILTYLHMGQSVEVKVEFKLRPTVSRLVRLGVRDHPGPVINYSYSLKFSLDSCGFVVL
jgi:hypothetical protein